MYFLNILLLWITRKIDMRSVVIALRNRPIAVAGRDGSYQVDPVGLSEYSRSPIQFEEYTHYNAPNADPKTLGFIIDFCVRELQTYGILYIYLIGSRACGKPRPDSDHDVLVVLSDSAPVDIGLGGPLHWEIFLALDGQRKSAKLGAIDLITLRESRFLESMNDPKSFASAAIKGGIMLKS